MVSKIFNILMWIEMILDVYFSSDRAEETKEIAKIIMGINKHLFII